MNKHLRLSTQIMYNAKVHASAQQVLEIPEGHQLIRLSGSLTSGAVTKRIILQGVRGLWFRSAKSVVVLATRGTVDSIMSIEVLMDADLVYDRVEFSTTDLSVDFDMAVIARSCDMA